MALPKIREQIEARVKDTGDTMIGRLTQTVNGNPYYELNDGTNRWFFQAIKADNASYIGPTSSKALKIDKDGNIIAQANLTVNGSIMGSIQEAIKATQDGSGNVITSTYLPLSGGVLTGGLEIKNTGPMFTMTNTTSGQDMRLYPASNSVILLNRNIAGNSSNYRALYLHNSSASSSINSALVLQDTINGTASNYNILHAGNYNNYAPTKSGTGATGTWPISVGGSATTLSRNDDLSMTAQGVSWFDIDGKAGAVSLVNDTPTNGWWHILRFNHQNTNEYYTDLAVPFNYNSLYYKRVASGTVESNKWIQILDEKNYTTYVPTKTGSGASGTWGINISGNASTANSSSNSSKLNGLSDTAFKRTWNAYAGKDYVGWLKLIEWKVDTAGHFNAHPFIFEIRRSYNSPSPESYIIAFTSSWGSGELVQLNGAIGNRIIEQFRISRDSSQTTYWLEMYVNTSYTTYQNGCECSVFGYYSFNGTLLESIKQTASVSTVTSLTTGRGIISIAGTDYTTYRTRNIASNTSALTSGSTALTNGYIYLQYK